MYFYCIDTDEIPGFFLLFANSFTTKMMRSIIKIFRPHYIDLAYLSEVIDGAGLGTDVLPDLLELLAPP